MGDEMLQTLYTRELTFPSKHVEIEDKENVEIHNEFRVFQDYLGLINLIQPEGFNSPLDSPVTPPLCPQDIDNIFNSFEFATLRMRKRMNSFDSDKSENSLGSRGDGEINLLFDGLGSTECYKPYQTSVSVIGEPLMNQVQLRKSDPFARTAGRMKVKAIGNQERFKGNQRQVCVFCRNNGESREFYSSHTLKDAEGSTTCPILRAYTCPLCKASGDNSHTIKYCPKYTPKPKDKINGLDDIM